MKRHYCLTSELIPNLSLLRTTESPLTAPSVSRSHPHPAHWESTCAAAGDVSQATCSSPRCHGVRVRDHGHLTLKSLPDQRPCPLEPLPGLTSHQLILNGEWIVTCQIIFSAVSHTVSLLWREFLGDLTPVWGFYVALRCFPSVYVAFFQSI